jgi:trehalose-phosphatase
MAQPLPLWQHLEAVLQRCRASARCAVFLDYDGTLTPLVTDPAVARLSPVTRQVLAALLHHPRYQVAIVSGRTLRDLQAHVADLTLYLAGNHGLEIAGPGLAYCHPEALRLQPQVRALAEVLQPELETVPGAWIEEKGLTLTVHMREVPASYVPLVQRRMVRLLRPAIAARVFVLRTGKAVVEIQPAVKWDKGEAVHWIVDHMRLGRPAPDVFPVYIGDDETDEEAFRALGVAGCGIRVGSECPYSAAHYYVESVEQTTEFLAVLSGLGWPLGRGGARDTPAWLN